MGWWKVLGSDHLIGDRPLDILGQATDQVVAEYQTAFGRRPTVAEWQALLVAVMGAGEPEFRCFADVAGPVDVVIRPSGDASNTKE